MDLWRPLGSFLVLLVDVRAYLRFLLFTAFFFGVTSMFFVCFQSGLFQGARIPTGFLACFQFYVTSRRSLQDFGRPRASFRISTSTAIVGVCSRTFRVGSLVTVIWAFVVRCSGAQS